MATVSAKWTNEEETTLVSEYSIHKKILQSKLNNKITTQSKKEIWRKISDKITSIGNTERNAEQCKKKFENLCLITKKTLTDIRNPPTGGGPPPKKSPLFN